MDSAARWKRAPVQFTMLDFLSLTAYFAVPLGLCAQMDRSDAREMATYLVLNGLGMLIASLIWWGSVRTAARAGIVNARKRLLMIGLLVPATYALGLVGGPASGVFLIRHAATSLTVSIWIWLLPIGILGLFLGFRFAVKWILAADRHVAKPETPWSEVS
jgi:hypothetical protein